MADDEFERIEWQADLTPGPDEPLILSLLKYRQAENREPRLGGYDPRPRNLTSSYLHGSKLHAPILDLDVQHIYIESTTQGHAHLYLPPMPRWRMFVMLWGLRVAGVIEQGNFWWSLRRGGTFVRLPDVKKPESEQLSYSYGMFFKIREKK